MSRCGMMWQCGVSRCGMMCEVRGVAVSRCGMMWECDVCGVCDGVFVNVRVLSN